MSDEWAVSMKREMDALTELVALMDHSWMVRHLVHAGMRASMDKAFPLQTLSESENAATCKARLENLETGSLKLCTEKGTHEIHRNDTQVWTT